MASVDGIDTIELDTVAHKNIESQSNATKATSDDEGKQIDFVHIIVDNKTTTTVTATAAMMTTMKCFYCA